VQRDFTASRPNQIWLSDITEHRTTAGMQVVLCSVMSLSHSEFGELAVKLRCTRSSWVATLTKLRRPFFCCGSPLRPCSFIMRRTNLLLTMSPRSCQRDAFIRRTP
jgi:hypothetical protein